MSNLKRIQIQILLITTYTCLILIHNQKLSCYAFSTSFIKTPLSSISTSSSSSSPSPSFVTTNPKMRIRRMQLNEINNNDDNSSSSSSGSGSSRSSQQDVNNLFATYMAQRKDKGFMDIKYNLGRSSTDSDANNDNGTSTGNDVEDGTGTSNTDNNINDGDSDSDGNTINMDGDGSDDEEEMENQSRRLGSSIPGIRRFLGNYDNNDDKVVQHIQLGGGGDPQQSQQQQQNTSSSSTNENNDSSTQPPNPPSLLEQDMQQINTNYEKYYSQMKDKIDDLRTQQLQQEQKQQQQQQQTQNGDSDNLDNTILQIPDNVDEILSQVIEEQRAYDVEEMKVQRALESFDEYEKRMKEKLLEETKARGVSLEEGMIGSGSSSSSKEKQDPIVKEIVDEANREQEIRNQQQEQYRIYQEYEDSLKKKSARDKAIAAAAASTPLETATSAASTSTNSNSNTNFDQMQLEVLKKVLEKRQLRSKESGAVEDEDLYLTDNIEEGIEELQKKINIMVANDASGGGGEDYKPETLKEWQMYRAIVTKLSKSNDSEDEDEDILGGLLDSSLSATTTSATSTEEDIRKKIEGWKEYQIKEEEMRKEAGLAITYRPPFEWSDKPEPEDESKFLPRTKREPFDREKAEEASSEFDQLALQVLNDLMNKTMDMTRREKIRGEIEALKEGIQARQEIIKNRGPYVPQKKVIKPIDIRSALGRGAKSSSKKKATSVESETDEISLQNNEVETQDIEKELDYSTPSEDTYVDEYLFESEVDEEEDKPPDSAFFHDLEEDLDPKVSRVSNPIDSIFTSDEEFDDDDDKIEINLGTMEEQKFRSMVARSGVRTKDEQNKLKNEWEEFQKMEQMMREKTGLSGTGKVAEPMVDTKFDVNNIFKDGDIDADAILGTIGKRPSRKNRGEKINTSETKEKQTVNVPDEVKDIQPQAIQKSKVDVDVQNDLNVKSDGEFLDEEKEEEKIIDNDSELVATTQEAPKIDNSSVKGSMIFGQANEMSNFDARKANLLEYTTISVAQLNTLMALKRSAFSKGVSPYQLRINKPFHEFGAIFMLEGVLADVTGLQFEAWKRTARTYDFNIPTLEQTKYASVHREEYAVQKIFYWTDDIFALRKVVETYKEKRYEVFQEWLENKNNIHDDNDSSSSEASNYNSNDDSVLEADVMKMQLSAWQKAARDYGFEEPTVDLVNLVGSINPDETVRVVFRWTNDFILSNNVAASYRKYLKEETSLWMEGRTNVPSTPQIIESSPKVIENKPKATGSTAGPSMEDYLQLKLRAWERVSEKHHFSLPSLSQVNVAEFAGPEKAVIEIFEWTNIDEELNAAIASYRLFLKEITQEWVNKTENQSIQTLSSPTEEEKEEPSIPLIVIREGVESWLSAVQEVFVPSVIVSNMNEELMSGILEEVGLSKFFPSDKRISSSNSYETDSQKMLGAALRAERRPDHCVVFSATPQSATSSHEIDMKNIAMVSPYPYYELTTADMTVRDFKSIGMINLKNVFSETATEEPMQQLQIESPRVQRKTLLKTRFWDEGDR